MKRLFAAIIAAGSIAALAGPVHAGDPDAGKQLFKSICNLCHEAVAGKNRVGPSLFGVVGRKTGSVPGYNYSDANKNSGITWTPEILDRYLISPQAVVPGTRMGYAGLKDDTKRGDLIAYLSTLK